MFSLYTHIPYCTAVCPYCDFNVYAAEPRPEARYVEALSAEMRTHAGREPWQGETLQTIYFGGGTPSLFAPASIARLIDDARSLWPLAGDPEVTLEATPESVSLELARDLRRAGVNRLSLGFQSMHPRHLQRLGRLHSPEDNRRAFATAREAGFANVSVDLIFGVPGQTVAEWEADLGEIAALRPEHVSVYGLTYEERTPFFRWRASGRLRAVDEETEEAMFLRARAILLPAGYEAYEISSFGRDGFRARHNRNYWIGVPYLGIGAGAHSYTPAGWGRRWSNERNHLRYMQTVEERGEAAAEVEDLSAAQAMAEFIFLALRRTEGIDTAAFEQRFGVGLVDRFAHVRSLCSEGLLEAAAGGYRLTPRGLLVADSVIASFV